MILQIFLMWASFITSVALANSLVQTSGVEYSNYQTWNYTFFFHGTDISGGGGVVRLTPEMSPVLIDLIQYDLGFSDDHTRQSYRHLRIQSGGVVRTQDQPAFELVQNRLRLWQASSPVLYHAIDSGLKYARFKALDVQSNEIRVQASFPTEVKTRFPNILISPAAFYTRTEEIWIRPSIWNQMGWYSQAGLLIHESLRHSQFSHASTLGVQKSFDEKILHFITARILLTEPRVDESLDTLADFRGVIEIQIDAEHSFKSATVTFCQNFSDLFSKSPHWSRTTAVDHIAGLCLNSGHILIPAERLLWVERVYLAFVHDYSSLQSKARTARDAQQIEQLFAQAEGLYLTILGAGFAKESLRWQDLQQHLLP